VRLTTPEAFTARYGDTFGLLSLLLGSPGNEAVKVTSGYENVADSIITVSTNITNKALKLLVIIIRTSVESADHLCGLLVRVPGC
jgi:hypothetical protein